MPLDAQHDWHRDQMVTAEEIFEQLDREFTLTPASEPRGSAPAELFLVDGGPATVGVIASVTRPFCGDCDRVRLTADGQVRNCLFAREESDLRGALRAGATDEELADRWVAAMATKLPGHGINDPTFLQPDRPMSAIGGSQPAGCPGNDDECQTATGEAFRHSSVFVSSGNPTDTTAIVARRCRRVQPRTIVEFIRNPCSVAAVCPAMARRASSKPSDFVLAAFAMTTATYGRTTAPTTKIHGSQPGAEVGDREERRPTRKHSVRMPIAIR